MSSNEIHANIFLDERGRIMVDTGHADVGPFKSTAEAQKHIDRMQNDLDEHAKAEALWDIWLKENLSSAEYEQHVSGVRTLVKTHEEGVVELIKKQGDTTVSLGYYRLKDGDR